MITFFISVTNGPAEGLTVAVVEEKFDLKPVKLSPSYLQVGSTRKEVTSRFLVRKLERMQGDYMAMVEMVHALTMKPELSGRFTVLLNTTMLGAPIKTAFTEHRLKTTPLRLTHAHESNLSGSRDGTVPMKELLSSVVFAYEAERLVISSKLALKSELISELGHTRQQMFRVERDRPEDVNDLFLATALSVWYASRVSRNTNVVDMKPGRKKARFDPLREGL